MCKSTIGVRMIAAFGEWDDMISTGFDALNILVTYRTRLLISKVDNIKQDVFNLGSVFTAHAVSFLILVTVFCSLACTSLLNLLRIILSPLFMQFSYFLWMFRMVFLIVLTFFFFVFLAAFSHSFFNLF